MFNCERFTQGKQDRNELVKRGVCRTVFLGDGTISKFGGFCLCNFFYLVKISIPRGTRNGNGTYTPYDGYAAAEDWKLVLADRADKAKARQEKAERAEAARNRKRAAKKVVKKLNEQGLDAMIHAEEES